MCRRACDQCDQCSLHPSVNLSFIIRVSIHLIDFIAVYNVVVSAIVVFRLVDNLRPCLANLRLFSDLITRSIRLQSQTMTLVAR